MRFPWSTAVRTSLPVTGDAVTERLERKCHVPESRLLLATHLLRHCCRPDPQYRGGTITSLYLDTAELRHFHDSEQGNHDRQKVRIRWYDTPSAGATEVPVYLEVKSRRGALGSKRRSRHLVSAAALDPRRWWQGILPSHELSGWLAGLGYRSEAVLEPVLVVTYRRERFIEIQTGARLSLDQGIRARLVSPRLDRGEGWLQMAGGVLEIKGRAAELPTTLRSLRFLGLDQGRYSKYATSLAALLDDPGSMGRSSPSGRLHDFSTEP
ncbi:MAG: polyphosphate polymerase domain-containing protein [Candidatus Latescibacterota bacterium]